MAQKRVARKKQNALVRYYRETVAELRKVSWPTRREATNLTVIVVIVVVILVIILGTLDVAFSSLLSLVFGF